MGKSVRLCCPCGSVHLKVARVIGSETTKTSAEHESQNKVVAKREPMGMFPFGMNSKLVGFGSF